MSDDGTCYDDGRISCDAHGLTIRRYYLPFGAAKHIEWAQVRQMQVKPMTTASKYRLWGTGDFRHWAALDWRRPSRDALVVLDLGGHVLPVITPGDVDAFMACVHQARPDLG